MNKNLEKLVTTPEETERILKAGIACEGVMSEVMQRNCFTSEELRIMIGTGYNDSSILPEKHPSQMNEIYERTFFVMFPETMKEYKRRSSANTDILIYLLEKGMIELEGVVKRFESWKKAN